MDVILRSGPRNPLLKQWGKWATTKDLAFNNAIKGHPPWFLSTVFKARSSPALHHVLHMISFLYMQVQVTSQPIFPTVSREDALGRSSG